MPENYYCLDNFFQKMTDLESPRKNNDCYFYYYSTCTKGDNCTFRHEPSALGCETTCSFWKEGKCINVRCNFRHMELRKNRKTIPCYWESQPSGCKKQHCPFMHVSKKDGDENENLSDDHDEICNIKSKNDEFAAPVVDPIVVNFEEESDNEFSTPTKSPHHKTSQFHDHLRHAHHEHVEQQLRAKAEPSVRTVRGANVEVKTLEEIKLDRIQAESAAYYSYSDELTPKIDDTDALNGRRGVFKRLQPLNHEKTKEVDINDVQVLTLDEIRRRKRQAEEIVPDTKVSSVVVKKSKLLDEQSPAVTRKKLVFQKINTASEFKIKTLAEIKAEKELKRKLVENQSEIAPESKRTKITLSKEPDEQEVSSTSKTDEIIDQDLSLEARTRVKCVVSPVKRMETTVELETLETFKPDLQILKTNDSDDIASNKIESQVSVGTLDEDLDEDMCKDEDSKLDDLLLDDDDDDPVEDGDGGLTLKAEDDILNDSDE